MNAVPSLLRHAIDKANKAWIRQPPRPDALGFDHKLMTPARLLELAGQIPVVIEQRAAEGMFLACGECGGSITRLGPVAFGYSSYRLTLTQLLADVLRHRVLSHDQSLSGGASDDR